MKTVLFTDPHLGVYNDSDLWLDITLNFYKHIAKHCLSNKINRIIIGGDFFHDRKELNTKTQNVAHRIADVLEFNQNLETYIIVGNHDCYYKNQIHPNTLELFKKYKHIHVIDEITKLDDILLVPWGSVPESTQGAKCCFGHFAINGFHMNDSYKCKDGLDVSVFKDFEQVFCGHFHTPSTDKNVTYLGAPYAMSFHDAGGVRGFYEFENGNLEFIEYEDAPKFVKIYTNDEKLEEEKIKDNIVRIIFNRDLGTTGNQNFIDNVLKCKPLQYSVNFTNIESEEPVDDDELVEMDSKEKIVDQFIDEQTFPANIKINTLKSMFKKMMKEAGDINTVKSSVGTKIECMKVGFQNFLSYGSKWQEIELYDGVNFVTGWDKDKAKSNGAGKSSFLEAIAYALFGKTARDIKQDQIINWKNKKNCKVAFEFKINNDSYKIIRGMKPNILEIYKNETLLDQDAHKTDYQAMFEEIFGMDVKMFMSLIHSNINSSANIMAMKKAEKRTFLEKMFGLEIYSEMNKLCNSKLQNIENKKYKIDTDMSSFDKGIESANNLKEKFKLEIESKKESINKVDEIKKQLDDLKETNSTIDIDIENQTNFIKEIENLFKEKTIEFEKIKANLEAEIRQLEKEIRKIEDQEEQRKENEKIQSEIDNIVNKIGNVSVINEKIETYENQVKDLEIESSKLEEISNEYNNRSIKYQNELVELKTNLKNIDKSLKLLSDGKCPTCGQDVTDPKNHYENEQLSIKEEISKVECKINELNEEIKVNSNNINNVKEEIKSINNKIRILNKTKDKINELESKIKEVGSEEKKDELIENRNSKKEELKNISNDFSNDKNEYNDKIKIQNEKLSSLKREKKVIDDKEHEYDIIKSKASEVEKHIESLNSMIKEQDENIEKINNDRKEAEEDRIKLNEVTDYVNAIKFILKDENIKQFTIKRIIPYFNKQTNHYLSEVNYSFYVNIDKWLDVEIKGPGIRNASYDSLSSGERKGVDLSIQLSLLDVSQMMMGCFPDILIFDELLDSSIDSYGMEQLMKIVRTKQKELNNKIFIISHRSEINPELIDHEYKVTKKNGFSTVNV